MKHLLGLWRGIIINELQCENKREEKKRNLGKNIVFKMYAVALFFQIFVSGDDHSQKESLFPMFTCI